MINSDNLVNLRLMLTTKNTIKMIMMRIDDDDDDDDDDDYVDDDA